MAVRNLASHNGPSTKPSTTPPNQTLYLSNLPDKIRKTDLRIALYTLFSTYGPVLDVVVMPNTKMRGQAWIAFRDVQASTQAMRSLEGMEFFGKEMKVQYGKGKSHAIAKLDGTYRMPAIAGTVPVTTDLQQQIFGAPPSAAATLPSKPVTTNGAGAESDVKGTKREREEDSDEEVAMDEESDAPMEEDSDDDD